MIPLGKVEISSAVAKLTLSPNSFLCPPGAKRLAFPAIGAEATVIEHLEEGALPPICTFGDDEDLVEPICLREHTEYDFTLVLKESEETVLAMRASNPAYPFNADKLKKFITFNSPDACYTQSDGQYRLTGRVNFLGHAGKADLSLVEELNLRLVVDVLSSKFYYLTEFRCLLEQLSDIHAELILKLDGATEAALQTSEASETSKQIQIIHLRRLFRPEFLPDSISTILNNPHHKFETETEHQPLAFVTSPNMGEIAVNQGTDWSKGGALARIFRGFTPEALPNYTLLKTFDTAENRFVKTSLKELGNLVDELSIRIPSCYAGTKSSLSRSSHYLTNVLSQPIWQGVKDANSMPNSMVLQFRTGYRDFLQQLLTFKLGLSLNTTVGEFNSTTGDLNPVHELYELWCYFQLRACLQEACKCEGTPALEHSLSGNGYEVNLLKGSKSAVHFNLTHLERPVAVRFFYNRTFEKARDRWSESYTARFHPDFSVEFLCEGIGHWIHFDSKYKLTHNDWVDALEGDTSESHSYKTTDLQTAHSYRDALLGTRGSFILYPGTTPVPDLLIRQADPIYRSTMSGPSVGAFALSPTKDTQKGRQQLTDYFCRLLDTITKHKDYSEEHGFKN